MIDAERPKLDKANDLARFCQNADTRRLWAEIIDALTYYESGYDPTQIYHEPPPLGIDSVGLLQLSYEDKQYGFCNLNKATKSLQDPINNLDCGIKIFAYWIGHDGYISTPQNHGAARYWSTLRQSRKLPNVIARVRNALGCK